MTSIPEQTTVLYSSQQKYSVGRKHDDLYNMWLAASIRDGYLSSVWHTDPICTNTISVSICATITTGANALRGSHTYYEL